MSTFNIFGATFQVPNQDLAINALIDNILSCQINAKTGVALVKYKINIDVNDTGASTYTNTVTLTSGNYKYDGDTLQHTLPSGTLTNGITYKWYITCYDASDLVTGVVSYETLIITNAPVVIAFDPPTLITAQRATFDFTYSQAQYIPIEYFQFDLYSNGVLEKSSGKIYRGKLSYEFTGFTNSTYQIKVKGRNVSGVEFESALKTFTVAYAQPNILIKPAASQNSETSLITINTAEVVQINGTATGSIEYIGGSLHIPNGSKVVWTIDVPSQFTTIINIPNKTSYTQEKIAELESEDGTLYYVGYNGTSFYFVNGIHEIVGVSRPLPSGEFTIAILPTEVYIIEQSSVEKISYDDSYYSLNVEPLILIDGYAYDLDDNQIFVLT